MGTSTPVLSRSFESVSLSTEFESIVGGASSPVTLTPEAAAPILSKLRLL